MLYGIFTFVFERIHCIYYTYFFTSCSIIVYQELFHHNKNQE